MGNCPLTVLAKKLHHRSDALRDLLPFVQFKKREKHQWRSVAFSKVTCFKPATLLKVTLLHRCFSRFLNCTNGTKSYNYHGCLTGSQNTLTCLYSKEKRRVPVFELSVSGSQNAIYFFVTTMSKKSHFTIFTIQNFVQNTKKHK